jgi:hypothetical protein
LAVPVRVFVGGLPRRYPDANSGRRKNSAPGTEGDVRSIRVALAGFIGVALALLALSVAPSMAGADPTCYTGCSTTVPPSVLGTQTGQQPAVLASGTTANSTGLAFTGADVAGTVAIALIALAGGGVLVGVSRRRRVTS